jgi:hypothetical protein
MFLCLETAISKQQTEVVLLVDSFLQQALKALWCWGDFMVIPAPRHDGRSKLKCGPPKAIGVHGVPLSKVSASRRSA